MATIHKAKPPRILHAAAFAVEAEAERRGTCNSAVESHMAARSTSPRQRAGVEIPGGRKKTKEDRRPKLDGHRRRDDEGSQAEAGLGVGGEARWADILEEWIVDDLDEPPRP